LFWIARFVEDLIDQPITVADSAVPRSIKTVSFTIRKRSVKIVKTEHLRQYSEYLWLLSVRIKSYYRTQKYVLYCIRIVKRSYLVVFTYFTDTIWLVVLQRIVTVNGPCLQRKFSKIRHELVIHRLALHWWCSRVLQSLLVVVHYFVSYCIVYDFFCAVYFDLGLE
jgi:hypothetical protein